MAGTQRIIGYKPATDPVGWGDTTAGTMRGTTFAGRNKGYWIARIGGRVGKESSSATTMRYAVFNANKSTSNPEARLGNTGTFPVNVVMADRVSGATFERNMITPVFIPANQPINLAALGTGASWAHGQDHSGALMYERGGLSGGLPTTFGSTNTRPEGQMALWAVAYEDAAPYIPLWIPETEGVSPGHGHSTIDDTPTIEFDFRSTNEALPGFSVGNVDKLTRYQVQIYNSSKTTKLRDSGRVNANSTMIANRRVTWTVPTALPPGQYVVRAQVFNSAGTPSAWLEWTINIIGAGSLSMTSPAGITNDASPDMGWNYTHKQSLAMDRIRLRVMAANGTTIVNPEFEFDFSPNRAAGTSGTLGYAHTGWPDLPAGKDYIVQGQAIDTDGQPSPMSGGRSFHVNARPNTPNYRQPLPGTITTNIPDLSCLASDPDNRTDTLTVTFYVRPAGGGPETVESYPGYYNQNSGRWQCQLLQNGAITPGDYGPREWAVDAMDPHGLVSSPSTWLAFDYVAPPVMTAVSPVGTIDVASPAFQWTVDRTQISYRVQLFNAGAGDPILNGDSGWVTSATTSHTFDKLILRNLAQVQARVSVITTGDIPGELTWEFDVAYTPPATVTGVTATTVAMPYDFPGVQSGVKVTWDEVATDPLEFDAYLLRRVNVNTGESIPLVVLTDIEQTEWTDETAPAGVEHEYQVMQRVWNNLDVIPSLPASAEATVTKITGIVITPVIGGGDGATFPFLDRFSLEHVSDTYIRNSWASKPRVSQGPLAYRMLDVSAILVSISGLDYRPDDQLRTVTELAQPYVDTDGFTRSRTVCVRLHDGRSMYGTITAVPEGDSPQEDFARRLDLKVVENNFNPGVL